MQHYCIHFDPSLLHIVHVGINTYYMYTLRGVFCSFVYIFISRIPYSAIMQRGEILANRLISKEIFGEFGFTS